MTQQPYGRPPFPAAPPAPAPPQPARKASGDSSAVQAWKFAGLLVMIAITSVIGALFMVWAVGLLHEWWPAIPTMGFGLALKLSLLLGAWYFYNQVGKEIMTWLRAKKKKGNGEGAR